MESITRIPTPYSYSSAVMVGNQVYLGLHRGFGEDFPAQFESTFAGITQTLAKVGARVEAIVKVNVWLKNIDDLPVMEELFKRYFEKDQFPARMTATTQFIDSDCLLMIDGIAIIDR